MIKKTITYKDFNDEETTEVFFFHLSRAELMQLEMSREGGFTESMKKVIAAQDNATVMNEMKKIILMSYGQKTPDGKKFIKNDRLREEFEASEAFSVLFMQMFEDADLAAEFFRGIVPQDIAQQAQAAVQAPDNGGATVDPETVKPQKMTMKEVRELSQEDYQQLSERITKGEVVIVNDLSPGEVA